MTIEEQITAYKLLRENGQAFFVNAYEDADRIISALEKQIPKKPKLEDFLICPNCDNYLIFGDKYCQHCGQLICWDLEGEEA